MPSGNRRSRAGPSSRTAPPPPPASAKGSPARQPTLIDKADHDQNRTPPVEIPQDGAFAPGLLAHKKLYSGNLMSKRAKKAVKQMEQGTYIRPKRNIDLKNREVGFGGRIGTVPGKRVEYAFMNQKQKKDEIEMTEEEKKKDKALRKAKKEAKDEAIRRHIRKKDEAIASAKWTATARRGEAEGAALLWDRHREKLEESKDRASWEARNPNRNWHAYRAPPTAVGIQEQEIFGRHYALGRKPDMESMSKDGELVNKYGRLRAPAVNPR